MKTLKQQTIIYDDECPMCAVYTGAFIKSGMLEKDGREPYSKLVRTKKYNIDWDRARNEIALVNKSDDSVIYGVDSLMFILREQWPWMRILFTWNPFYRSMVQLYKFVSYNRKAIAPGREFEAEYACVPDYHTGYRWAFILFSWLITSLILSSYTVFLNSLLELNEYAREFIICGGQIVWQGLLVYFIYRERVLHYLGNMMTVSLSGALLLLPAFALQWTGAGPWIYAGYFILVAGWMLLEHIRRVRILELPWYVTASWVMYRIVVLIMLLSL